MKDPNVLNLEYILESLAAESEKLLKAGSEGNETSARASMDRIRQLNSDIQDVDAVHKAHFDSQSTSKRAKISELLSTYKRSEAFRKAWSNRYSEVGPIKLIMELPDGPNGILDMIIPEAWDWNFDIIVFSSLSDQRLIKSLLNRGHKRVIVFSTQTHEDLEKIEGVTYIDKEDQVDYYFSNLAPDIPNKVFVVDKVVEPGQEIDLIEKEVRNKFIKRFEKAFGRIHVNRNTTNVYGSRWINQGIENLPIIACQPSIGQIAPKIEGKPVVIISPGPSLDKNIQDLKLIRDRAILIAPAQTILALQKEGLSPDIVMVADPQDYRYLFEGFDMTPVHALLVGVSCHPDLYKDHSKKVISTPVNGPIDAWVSDIFKDHLIKGGGGSVSTLAFLIAGQLKCSSIILVGQDLSFADGKQYSSGSKDAHISVAIDESKNTFSYNAPVDSLDPTLKDLLAKNEGMGISKLPGYFGGVVNTKFDYAMFHAEFERWANLFNKAIPKPRLLNCTEGGAYIEGFEHVSLRFAAAELKNENFPIIDKAAFFRSIFESNDKKSRLLCLQHALSDIEIALKDSAVIATMCARLAENIETGKSKLDELSKHEKNLMQIIKASNFISIAIQDQIRKTLKMSTPSSTLAQNLVASRLLYNLIITESHKILPTVSKSLSTVNSILESIKE